MTPARRTARSRDLCSVSSARRRLNSTIRSASDGTPRRMVRGMVASFVDSLYPFTVVTGAKDPFMDLAKYIRDIPDFPKPGILFKDITPLLAEPQAFRQAIHLMHQYYHGRQIDSVAAA